MKVTLFITIFLFIPSMSFGSTITRCTLAQSSTIITINGGMLFLFSADRVQKDCFYQTWTDLFNTKTHYECRWGDYSIRLTTFDDGKEEKEGSVYMKIEEEEFYYACHPLAEEAKVSDPYFDPYIQEFVLHGKRHLGADFELGDIPINFVDHITGDRKAFCYNKEKQSSGSTLYDYATDILTRKVLTTEQIIIDKGWWFNEIDAIHRSVTIARVLGECRLKRTENRDDDRFSGLYIAHHTGFVIPGSLMSIDIGIVITGFVMHAEIVQFLQQVRASSEQSYLRMLSAYYKELFTHSDDLIVEEFDDFLTYKNSF